MPANMDAKISWLKGAIWSRETWLEEHGSKWPAHDRESKAQGLEVMREILSDYELSVERAREREAKE